MARAGTFSQRTGHHPSFAEFLAIVAATLGACGAREFTYITFWLKGIAKMRNIMCLLQLEKVGRAAPEEESENRPKQMHHEHTRTKQEVSHEDATAQ